MPTNNTSTSTKIKENGEKEAMEEQEIEFDYELFLRKMKLPECQPLLSKIKDFINDFKVRHVRQVTAAVQIEKYREFIDLMVDEFKANPVWRLISGEDDDQQGKFGDSSIFLMVRECLEYLIMNQLYPVAFIVDENDFSKDSQVSTQYKIYSEFIKPRHLDLENAEVEEKIIEKVSEQFNKLNEYYTPRDKMISLLNACKMLESMLSKSSNLDGDRLLSMIIYVLIKTRMSRLNSNLQFIGRWRDPSCLQRGQSNFYYTLLLAACGFIAEMDESALVYENDQEMASILGHKEAILAQVESENNNPSLSSNEIQRTSTSPTTLLKQDAKRLFSTVKSHLKRGAHRSMEFIEGLVDEADGRVSGGTIPATEMNEEELEAMHLELAMAISREEYISINHPTSDSPSTPNQQKQETIPTAQESSRNNENDLISISNEDTNKDQHD